MKKTLLVLITMILSFALVACGTEKAPDPEQTEGDVTTTTATPTTTTAQKSKFKVRFLDSEQFGSTVIYETEVARNKGARAPIDPSHEGYVFVGWDCEDFSSITADLDIVALYRPLDTYYVVFYDINGAQIGEKVKVAEGSAVEGPQAPKIFGKFFVGWDKVVAKVDRSWPDFERYSKLSSEELAKTELVYKVNALYEASAGVISYQKSISMELKETKDENGVKIYEPVDDIFRNTNAVYYSDSYITYGDEAKEQVAYAKAKYAVAWDGDWVYVYTSVYDPTLLTRGEEYCMAEVNPWKNDAIEVHYTFNVEPTKLTRNVVKIDAFGYRKFADPIQLYTSVKEQSNFFEEIEVTHAISKEANSYYAIFKIPAKNEEGVKVKGGDAGYFSEQINDLRSTTEPIDFICSGGYRHYYHLTNGTPTRWKNFTFAMVE
jgi:hypothetical protein